MNEKALIETKWFDYRNLNPDLATMVFIGEWARALTAYNESLENDLGKHLQFLKNYERFEVGYLKEKKAAFWKQMTAQRQFADKHAMKYGDYWAFAFEGIGKLGFKKTFLTVFNNERLREYIVSRCRERYAVLIKKSDSAVFRAENYIGSEIQRDYYANLIGQIKDRYPLDYPDIVVRLAHEGTIAWDYLKSLKQKSEKDAA